MKPKETWIIFIQSVQEQEALPLFLSHFVSPPLRKHEYICMSIYAHVYDSSFLYIQNI